jgi:hypothetical protein
MRKELNEKLCKAFPYLYREIDVHHAHLERADHFYFECGDGWYDLLYKCSARIEREIIAIMIENPAIPFTELPVAAQVKEKFGTLRFYVSWNSNPEIDAAVREAEEASEITCEDCGRLGDLLDDGWWRTLCNICEAERNKPDNTCLSRDEEA